MPVRGQVLVFAERPARDWRDDRLVAHLTELLVAYDEHQMDQLANSLIYLHNAEAARDEHVPVVVNPLLNERLAFRLLSHLLLFLCFFAFSLFRSFFVVVLDVFLIARAKDKRLHHAHPVLLAAVRIEVQHALLAADRPLLNHLVQTC